MNWKWYIPLLVVVFAFAGMTNQQSALDANQEILIEFSEIEVDDLMTDDVISDITAQLKALGADNIRISKLPFGRLKIHYYSALDVSEVQEILNYSEFISAKNESDGKSDKIPSEENHSYNIAVVKILKEAELPLQGTTVDIIRLQDNFVKPKLIASGILPSFTAEFSITAPDERILTEEIKHPSEFLKSLPEIRAGPFV